MSKEAKNAERRKVMWYNLNKGLVIGLIIFCLIVVAVYISFTYFEPKNQDHLVAPVSCPAPEPCTLQRCTGLTGIAEFLGNYFLCETPDDPSWCYAQEQANCNERCQQFLTNRRETEIIPAVSEVELEVIQTCEAVCKNQLDIFKTNRYFEKKQCEWAPSDTDTLWRIEQGSETIKRLSEDLPYYTLFKHEGKSCYQTFVKDEIYTCMVCVGDTWEQVSADDIYSELNADPFNPQIKPLKVKILEIKEGWVRFKRIDGDPANRKKVTFSIEDVLCTQFSKVEK